VHFQRCREMFERDVSVCIENLQFHDRMLQQISHAKKTLTDHNGDSVLPDGQ